MKKQITKCWQSFLLAAFAIFIVPAASSAVFAQDKYPKPDFSAMAEYWEVVESEYDFAGGGVPRLNVIAKPKQKSVPMWWDIVWRDEKGIIIDKYSIKFGAVEIGRAKIGEPVQGSSFAPFKKYMPQVKSVTVTGENPSGGDATTAN